jgi:mycothiol synthase
MDLSHETRTLRAEDRPELETMLRAALESSDLRASSDPDLVFTMQLFSVQPGWFGGAFAGDELVGVVMPELKIAVVRPEQRRRGIGSRLVRLALRMEADRGRPELFLGCVPEAPGGAAFLQATGFVFHSTVWNLDLPADRTVAPPVWPDGLVPRPFDRTRDVVALPAIVNVSFADHPTPMVMEEEMVRASLDDPNVVDEDVLLLEDAGSGELVGFCMLDVLRKDGAVTSSHGEIAMLGVRPDRQGRGLGRQLLRAGARYLRAAGVPDVGLAVNARNEGALALYESEGYVRARTRDRWSQPVLPTAPLT